MSEVPIFPNNEQIARGSKPWEFSSSIEREPSRFDKPLPSLPTNKGVWANVGICLDNALKTSIWAPELVTWSSPRITCVMFSSISSTTLGKVYKKVPSPRIKTGSERDEVSTLWFPRTMSSQVTIAPESLKRQWGLLPSSS